MCAILPPPHKPLPPNIVKKVVKEELPAKVCGMSPSMFSEAQVHPDARRCVTAG